MNVPAKTVTIYTDGACLGNPGAGGYGIILIYNQHRKTLAGGYQQTTNNRMEMIAAIKGLEALNCPCRVTLFSDSRYLVDAMSKGWAKKWKAQNWMRNAREKAKNPDLWHSLLELCAVHQVEFRWVRGHAGHPENEACDRLAIEAAKSSNLSIDEGYKGG